jgi:hypothetical protein
MAKRKAGSQIVKFDSRPLKVWNCPDFLALRWCVTYGWKALDEGYNFTLNLTLIESLHTKLCTPKVAGVPISGIPGGSPRTKRHLGASLVAKQKKHYKGESGGFPQIQAVVSLVSLCLLLAHPCTKGGPTVH